MTATTSDPTCCRMYLPIGLIVFMGLILPQPLCPINPLAGGGVTFLTSWTRTLGVGR